MIREYKPKNRSIALGQHVDARELFIKIIDNANKDTVCVLDILVSRSLFDDAIKRGILIKRDADYFFEYNDKKIKVNSTK